MATVKFITPLKHVPTAEQDKGAAEMQVQHVYTMFRSKLLETDPTFEFAPDSEEGTDATIISRISIEDDVYECGVPIDLSSVVKDVINAKSRLKCPTLYVAHDAATQSTNITFMFTKVVS